MSVILAALVDFIYPKRCVACDKEGAFLCDLCLVSLKKAELICPECMKPSLDGWTHPRCKKKRSLDGIISTYSYRDPKVRKSVEAIKFGFNKELIRLMMGESILAGSFDYYVPVPLHRRRLNWRGFNQAEEIALMLPQTGKLVRWLARSRNTKQQARIKNKEERKKNVNGAFEIDSRVQRSELRRKRILLVDDVFTTGESMKECCRVLKRVGAHEVWGFVLAH